MSVQDDIVTRPRPEMDPTTTPYWESAGHGVLTLQWCAHCSHFIHAPMSRCWRCHRSTGLEWREVSGRGVIHSFIVIHNSRLPGFGGRGPHVVAMVEIEEQDHVFMFANVLGAEPGDVAVGDRVEVTFDETIDGITIPQFRIIA